MNDKPLHVLVAEALGWIEVQKQADLPDAPWIGWYPFTSLGHPCPRPTICSLHHLPLYDTDWSATGPLIEKYVSYMERVEALDEETEDWKAFGLKYNFGKAETDGRGSTPLVAVCNLILALAKTGRKVQNMIDSSNAEPLLNGKTPYIQG